VHGNGNGAVSSGIEIDLVDRCQQLIEKVCLMQQQQLSYSAQRRMIAPFIVLLSTVLSVALWGVVEVLDCTALEYINGLRRAIERALSKAASRPPIDTHEARRLVQPASILFFWWVLYSWILAVTLLGAWYFLRRAELKSQADIEKAEEEHMRLLPDRSPRATRRSAANRHAEVRQCDDEGEEEQAESMALRQLDELLSHNLDDKESAARCHDTLALTLSTAMQACGANGVASAAARYTAPHELSLEELRCPISLTQMRAAVSVLPCGHVFDRPSLVSFIASANKSGVPARCPFGCESKTMTVIANGHVRKAVADSANRFKVQERDAGRDVVPGDGSTGTAGVASDATSLETREDGEYGEYGDAEAVAAIFGSVEMLEAYRNLLTDSALPAVFECEAARARQLDSLLLHLEGLGWYHVQFHPLADADADLQSKTMSKLQALLRVVLPLSTDALQHNSHKWLLQPSRTLVLLTQILRRVASACGPVISPSAQAQALIGMECAPCLHSLPNNPTYTVLRCAKH
jgi:hypothetical protein